MLGTVAPAALAGRGLYFNPMRCEDLSSWKVKSQRGGVPERGSLCPAATAAQPQLVCGAGLI